MKRKHLRTGFTTGTAAAAAAKGAVRFLLEGRPPTEVSVALLTGDRMTIPVHSCRRTDDVAACTVIKDAGDDPDVTHGAEIGAVARLLTPPAPGAGPSGVLISGGDGVAVFPLKPHNPRSHTTCPVVCREHALLPAAVL